MVAEMLLSLRPTRWLLWALLLTFAAPLQAERVRDLGAFQGVRSNQLTGYGIVVGLDGTGDDTLDYLTQAIGKAKSLRGGALILAPLYGADGQIYAMAQGNLAVGGLGISGRDGSKLSVNVPTVGRIPEGASVERAVATGFNDSAELRWNLYQADFLTASRVRDAINARFPGSARVEDGVTLSLALPALADSRATQMATIEMLTVVPAETPAKVIVNSRTGTVVINSAVRLAPAAISHGKLVLRVDEKVQVSQPNAFSQGQTTVTPQSAVNAEEQGSHLILTKGGASLAKVVDALNLLGVGPSDLVEILQALKEAGALKAEMEVF